MHFVGWHLKGFYRRFWVWVRIWTCRYGCVKILYILFIDRHRYFSGIPRTSHLTYLALWYEMMSHLRKSTTNFEIKWSQNSLTFLLFPLEFFIYLPLFSLILPTLNIVGHLSSSKHFFRLSRQKSVSFASLIHSYIFYPHYLEHHHRKVPITKQISPSFTQSIDNHKAIESKLSRVEGCLKQRRKKSGGRERIRWE